MERAAIYLVGQGPHTDPRLVELQYLRIKRAIDLGLIRKERKEEFSVLWHPYIDLNFPRAVFSRYKGSSEVLASVDEVITDFPSLQRLGEAIGEGMLTMVLMDLGVGVQSTSYDLGFIPNYLEMKGAEVVNCYYDTPGLISTEERQTARSVFMNIDTEPDYREFIALFPRLAGQIIKELMGYENERLALQQTLDIPSATVPHSMSLEEFKDAVGKMTSPHSEYSTFVPRLSRLFREVQDLSRKKEERQAGATH